MKRTERTYYKFYRLTAGYKEVKKSCAFFQYLLILVHLIFASFLMLLNISDQLKESLPFLGEGISNFEQNYMTNQTALMFSYASIGLNLVFIVITGIRLNIIPMYNEFNRYKKIERYLFICTSTLGYIYEFTIYIIGWSIANVEENQGFLVFLAVGFLSIIIFTYFNFQLDCNSLYKWFTVPLIFLITFLQTIFSYILIIAVSLYFIMIEKMLFKKISYGLIILLSLFVLQHTLFNNTNPSQMLISLISLGILTLLSSFLIFKLKNKSLLSTHQAQIQNSFNILSQIKSNPFNQLKFKQFHSLYNTVMKFATINKEDKNKEIENILQKAPQKITKLDFFLLLQKYLDKQIKKSTKNNFHKQIIRFKIRMELDHPVSEMTQQLFLLNEEFLKSNKNNQNEFFELLDSAIKRYCVFNDGILQTAFIYHTNELHETFQQKVIDILDKISQFWKNLTKSQIKRTQLDSLFDELIDMKNDIEWHCKEMQKYGNFQRQRKVINNLKGLFNCYEEQNKISVQNIKTIMQKNQQEIHHSFLILQENLIKFVSKDLVKNLGQKGSSSYENVDKKVLFGEQFSSIVDNMIKNMNLEIQKEWLTIPILRKDGLIDLKRINIMWYPSLETKCKLMVQFSDDRDLRKEACLIYQNKSDTIKYANKKFIENFGINKEKFLQKLRNEQLFFNELFIQGETSSQQIRKQLKEDSLIKCKLYIKSFVQKGVINLISVEVKVAKWINLNNGQRYGILRVYKNDDKRRLASKSANSQNLKARQRQRTLTIGNNLLNNNQRSLSKKYEKQKFFCPIPNHYQSKITEKQAQLQEKNRWVWRYYIHFLVAVMFLTIIILWGLDYKFFSDRVTSYISEKVAIQNTSEQYALLYQLYTLVSKRYYMRNFPKQIQLATNKTYQFVDNYYQTMQQSAIDQFLRRYLTQINDQPSKNIVYNLQFQYFNITTDSQQSTLLDFAEKFKRNLVNNDIDFLMKNYDSFRNLTIQYEDSFTYDEFTDGIVASYSVYFYILIATTCLSSFFIFYTLFKIQDAISVIYSLFQLISLKKFEENCSKFKAKKQKIISSLHRPVTQSNKVAQNSTNNNENNQIVSNSDNSTSTKLTVTTINHLHQPQSQTTLNVPSTSHFQNASRFKDNAEDSQLNQNQISEKKTLLEENSLDKKQQDKKRIKDETLLLKINRKLYFIILLIGFNAVFVYDYFGLMEQKSGIIQLFGIRRSLYVSLLHVNRIQTDAIIQPVMRQYFNKSINYPYQTTKIDLVSDISQQFIFSQLDDFKEQARTFLASDMCLVVGKALTINLKPCSAYLDGIVTKGFGETFDIYQLNANVTSKQTLYDFGPYLCQPSQCTPYYEHVYVSVLMANTIRYVINILNGQTALLGLSRLQKCETKILYKMAAMVIILVFYFFFDYNLKKRCKRSIDYFRTIPKELMCTMKVTAYMRKNETLNKFDIL